jgi:SAM-dependent methyltransferase
MASDGPVPSAAGDPAAANQRVFEGVAATYDDLSLKPAERAVLGRFAAAWPDFEMLDLGVGSGRTAWTFAPLVRRYVGVDYAPSMVERARKLLGKDPNVTIELGDARDLSTVEGVFDFVLFSFNGIDAVSAADRLRVLDGVRARLRPGGLFLFSTHSLGALPFDTRRSLSPRFSHIRAYRAYAWFKSIAYARRIRAINRGLDLSAARARGWDVVPSMAHNFRITDHYVDPEFQVRQLREHGFEVVAVYDPEGREVTLPHPGRDPWLDFLCAPI